MNQREILNTLPDARDGLTRVERVILYVLNETQRELGGRSVPSVMLYGRVLEYLDLSEDELQMHLVRLGRKSEQDGEP